MGVCVFLCFNSRAIKSVSLGSRALMAARRVAEGFVRQQSSRRAQIKKKKKKSREKKKSNIV